MAGGINKLSDKAVRAFLANATLRERLSDGGSLYLFITPAGTPTWRVKYRDFNNREQIHSPGIFPETSLAAARVARAQVKEWLKAGIDPATAKRMAKATAATNIENTFQAVAAMWLAKQKPEWSAVHYTKSARAIERDINPGLGKLPIGEITPLIVANAVDEVSKRGAKETAVRILQHVNSIFKYARAKGYCTTNPADGVEEALLTPDDSKPRPAIVDLNELGKIMRTAKTTSNSQVVHRAHRLCAFTGARINNVIQAEWKEFDLDGETPMWTIPRAKLKIKKRSYDHRIPLHTIVVAELREWRDAIGSKGYVFPSSASKLGHVTREGVEKLYRESLSLRDVHSPHSWRSAIKTNTIERGWADKEVSKIALDHLHDDEVALAYDHGERFSKRVHLFHTWQSVLLAAERGEHQIPFDKLHLHVAAA
ncbi:tyrosine-type recombinase/integrase [Rugamonas apoptosis]|uniref:Integrase arm-type DNA-binding domain-containing protein n=1 Tax=Rugamonas apoptosis TaxID=2758570 RepID=A0A7W2FE01_9BURK|nr:integrase arm-type DNA-binding domain-containing protein [Rugamonas apoptosis]MBA5689996.1 integrase arm-type DNA-binding domain-containing protein [Rugamonas apoptosis]